MAPVAQVDLRSHLIQGTAVADFQGTAVAAQVADSQVAVAQVVLALANPEL